MNENLSISLTESKRMKMRKYEHECQYQFDCESEPKCEYEFVCKLDLQKWTGSENLLF